MMQFMYLWLPLIFDVLILVILSKMNVEAENERIKLQRGIGSDIVMRYRKLERKQKAGTKIPAFYAYVITCATIYPRNSNSFSIIFPFR